MFLTKSYQLYWKNFCTNKGRREGEFVLKFAQNFSQTNSHVCRKNFWAILILSRFALILFNFWYGTHFPCITCKSFKCNWYQPWGRASGYGLVIGVKFKYDPECIVIFQVIFPSQQKIKKIN